MTSTTAAVRSHVDPNLFGAVNAEWRTLCDRPPTDRAGTPWPLPIQVESLQGIVDSLTHLEGGYATVDATLLALLQLHHDGDSLAGRVVLQAMLGAAVHHVPTALGRGLDGEAEAIASMWTSIATYPLHRETRVAANLSKDALKHLHKAQTAVLPAGDAAEVSECQDDPHGALSGAEGPSTSDEASKVLLWGLDHDIITAEEGQLLANFYLGDGWNSETPSTPAERQRRSRAVRKLARAATQLL